MTLSNLNINKTWTVFLDRDGVINKKIENGYVLNLSMFEWINKSKEAIVKLSEIFGRIIVVTNQQGIGKRLMSENDLNEIHANLKLEIEKNGGRIDAFYFGPNLKEENNVMRKPGIGMPLKAKQDFSEIDFSKSIMIGDSVSDMEMAEKLGMIKIFIGDINGKKINADFYYSNLIAFTDSFIIEGK